MPRPPKPWPITSQKSEVVTDDTLEKLEDGGKR
jgi:hypothetical protein